MHYLLLTYSLSDILFYFWFRRTLRLAQRPNDPPVLRLDEMKRVWKAITTSALPGESPFSFMRNWLPIAPEEVGRRDVKNGLAVGFFGLPLERLPAGGEELMQVDRMFDTIEQYEGIRFPVESPSDMPALRLLSVDPVPSLHRPLFVYLCTSLMDIGSDFVIWICGFRRYTVGCMSFWVRKGTATRATGPWDKPRPAPPLVFVHGVGLGLVTYLPFMKKLFKVSEHRSVMLIELPHVSMKLNLDITPTMHQVAECTERAMVHFEFPPALWVCHSLGTFVFAGVNRLKPHLIDACVLIDPVCFMLWTCTTMTNFCYCDPVTPMQIVQQYHVCKELLISWYFHRHFYFTDAVLLREDLPKKALMVISEADNIYDTDAVMQYLALGGVDMKVFPGTPHGGWILSRQQTEEILDEIECFYDRRDK